MLDQIPVNLPLVTEEDKQSVSECLADNWISSEGPVVNEFEKTFAKAVQRDYGVAVTNGTTALELAFRSLDLKPGDEVIVPTFTIISCALAVINAGATPVFVDADDKTWNMDVGLIEAAITPRTRAILVVHIYHFPSEMNGIEAIAKAHNLIIVEDAAEMHGQTYFDKPCGSFGLLSTFSFYANKIITTGEGGMVVTNRKKIADRCEYMRNLCFNNGQRFKHDELSSNYRMTSMQAALGLSQTKRLAELTARKRSMGKMYTELLSDVDGLDLPLESISGANNIYWVYGVKVSEKLNVNADAIMKELAREGVGTRPFFFPLHDQPALHKLGIVQEGDFPVAAGLRQKGFYIPSGLGMSSAQQEIVVDRVKKVIRQLK